MKNQIDEEKKIQFVKMNHILTKLKEKDVQPALEWVYKIKFFFKLMNRKSILKQNLTNTAGASLIRKSYKRSTRISSSICIDLTL